MNTRMKGFQNEEIALRYLKAKNYIFIEKNFYTPFGELDLIMRDKDFLVFIEVKSINQSTEFSIYETLTKNKKKRLRVAIGRWLIKNNKFNYTWRFDFLGIVESRKGFDIEHFAFVEL